VRGRNLGVEELADLGVAREPLAATRRRVEARPGVGLPRVVQHRRVSRDPRPGVFGAQLARDERPKRAKPPLDGRLRRGLQRVLDGLQGAFSLGPDARRDRKRRARRLGLGPLQPVRERLRESRCPCEILCHSSSSVRCCGAPSSSRSRSS